jgi:Flp pilus assembly protein TadG
MAEMKQRRRGLRSEEGAQLVEFALVLPLLLLVVLAIADFGFMFQRYEVLTNAAREGARIAVLPGYGLVDVQQRVDDYLDAGLVPEAGRTPAVMADVPVVLPSGTTVTTRRVTVTYTYSYMFVMRIAGWFDASYTTQQLSAVSQMRVEVPGS